MFNHSIQDDPFAVNFKISDKGIMFNFPHIYKIMLQYIFVALFQIDDIYPLFLRKKNLFPSQNVITYLQFDKIKLEKKSTNSIIYS